MHIYIYQDFVLGGKYIYISYVSLCIYIYRYIETVTSLPDRQCPEQGRVFFVVQDFVLGVIYIYLYTRTLSLECIYAYIYIPGLCPWR